MILLLLVPVVWMGSPRSRVWCFPPGCSTQRFALTPPTLGPPALGGKSCWWCGSCPAPLWPWLYLQCHLPACVWTQLGAHPPLQALCIKFLCLLTDLPEANALFNEVFQITPSHGGCNNTDHCPLASKNSVLLTLFCAFWSSSWPSISKHSEHSSN